MRLAGMAIHLRPPVTRRLMRPTRGLGSAPLPPATPGCALLFGLAPGGVCRVSLRSGPRAGRHRHCGTGPRLTADGRYPPPCAVELGLSSRRPGCPADARPSDRLAGPRVYSSGRDAAPAAGRRTTTTTGASARDPVDGLVGERVRRRCSGRAARGRRSSRAERSRSVAIGCRPERLQLRRP